MSIKGYYRQEERYIGLNLAFVDDSDKAKILQAIEDLKSKYENLPNIFESKKDNGGGIYIEFNDDYDKEAGEYLEELLHKLNIVCECDDVMCNCSEKN